MITRHLFLIFVFNGVFVGGHCYVYSLVPFTEYTEVSWGRTFVVTVRKFYLSSTFFSCSRFSSSLPPTLLLPTQVVENCVFNPFLFRQGSMVLSDNMTPKKGRWLRQSIRKHPSWENWNEIGSSRLHWFVLHCKDLLMRHDPRNDPWKCFQWRKLRTLMETKPDSSVSISPYTERGPVVDESPSRP